MTSTPSLADSISAEDILNADVQEWSSSEDLVPDQLIEIDVAGDYGFIEVENSQEFAAKFEAPWAFPIERRRVVSDHKVGDGETIGRSRLSPLALTPGMHCFVDVDEEWRRGLVIATLDSDHVEISTADGDIVVPVTAVRVRRLGALVEPLRAVGEHASGNIGRYVARHAYVSAYEELAAVGRGLGAVFSSSVELHPHQLRVVERVLDDPFQRYLLADEVGLGKTIEAGFIIRQRLLDAPRSIIVVFCPGSLVPQWQEELDDKLGIRDFKPDGIDVVAYDEEPRPFRRHTVPDLIVIDEAHRVVAEWDGEDEAANDLFQQAARLAWATPRVLLLSATPALHHERPLLGMLHLLDPDTYKLDAADDFVERVRGREQLADVFARLSQDSPAFILRRALHELVDLLPKDQRLVELADAVQGTLTGEVSDETDEALNELRVHVTETYRVHRRVVRNRRNSIGTSTFRLRGRNGLRLIEDSDERRTEVDGWLTLWRSALAEELSETPEQRAVAVAIFFLFLERSTGDLGCLDALGRAILTRHLPDYEAAGCLQSDRVLLRNLYSKGGQLRSLLERLGDLLASSSDREWIDCIAESIAEFDKSVVFATSKITRSAIAERLVDAFGNEAVVEFGLGQGSEARRENSAKFRRNPECRVLVADRSGEEGLNLQEGEAVVHVDLPVDAVRVEQRIGRLDRRSDKGPVLSIALAPPADSVTELWLRALDGFGVFHRSTAALQYAIQEVQGQLKETLTWRGPSATGQLVAEVRGRVEEEQARIDRVDGLDALAGEARRESHLIEAYEESEELVPGLLESIARVVEEYGGQLAVAIDSVDRDGLSARIEQRNFITDRYRGLLPRDTEPPRDTELVGDRGRALAMPGVRLARPGTPILEILRGLLDWEDEGQTFATWCEIAADEGNLVAFCCDFLMSADVRRAVEVRRGFEATLPVAMQDHRSGVDAPLDRTAFQRWTDSFLPPKVIRVWVDASAEVLHQTDITNSLELGLREGQTKAWTPKAWHRAEILANVESFNSVIDDVGGAATAEALDRFALISNPLGAAQALSQEAEEDLLHLELRGGRETGPASAKRELGVLRALIPELKRSVESPTASWIGAGIVVMADEPLPR